MSVVVTKENYRVLSRKYRPGNLGELREQDVLVKTLSFAIAENKLAQSYLLTGIRGIGKTTTARIIAKTINCTNSKIENNIPIACEKCSNCTSFANNSHPDIIEIDAASRTGVDDIRVIIENAEYKPLLGKYKAFIIDEVHMLSKNAFNALLKLLEEPPAHTIFIFATTEVHKIPLTIISRCQRFDLARFSKEGLAGLLTYICELENINCEPDAIKIIAIKADGSARDALSLLDQARMLLGDHSTNNAITKDHVNKMISAVDHALIIEFLQKIIEKDSSASLKILEEFYSTNSDFSVFIIELLSLFAYIAKKIAIPNYQSHDFYSHEDEINLLAAQTDMVFTQIGWQLCYKTQDQLKNTTNQLEHLEMLALKLIYVISSKDNGNKALQENSPAAHNEMSKNVGQSLLGTAIAKTSKDEINHQLVGHVQYNHHPSFDNFLKFLNNNSEMDLYYTLLNKAEFCSMDDNIFTIKLEKNNQKIESELKNQLKLWNDIFIMNFQYGADIMPYKESLKQKIMKEEVMQKLVKNFADARITDILMRMN